VGHDCIQRACHDGERLACSALVVGLSVTSDVTDGGPCSGRSGPTFGCRWH